MRSLLRFSRQNAIGLLALFVALGGTSYAAVALPKNSVGTNQLKKGAVGNSDLGKGSVTGSKIRGNSIGSSKVIPGSLLASDFKSGQLPKPVTSAPPSGAAGGSLTGSYPNPGLAAGSVTASTLGKLPAVRLNVPSGATLPVASVTDPATGPGVTFPATQYNNGGQFGVEADSAGSSALRVPVSGVYSVTAQVIWVDTALGTTPRQDNGDGTRSLFINGPQPGGVRASSTIPAVNDTPTRQSVATSEYFAAGDTITLSAAQTSGVPLVIRGSQNQVSFSATLLTP